MLVKASKSTDQRLSAKLEKLGEKMVMHSNPLNFTKKTKIITIIGKISKGGQGSRRNAISNRRRLAEMWRKCG